MTAKFFKPLIKHLHIQPLADTLYNVFGRGDLNALGKAIDPLVIFTGKNFQSSWKGKSPLPNTMYGVSHNGWMNTQVFHQWFEKFCRQVTEATINL